MDTDALKKTLLEKFQEVSADRLQKIQLGVLDLEKPNTVEAGEEIARELHTMKGEARMMGLAAIGQLAHATEDVLTSAREGKTSYRDATDLMLRACDMVSDLLEDLAAAERGSPPAQALCKSLSDSSGHPIPLLHPSGAPTATKPIDLTNLPSSDRSIRVNVEVLDALGQITGDLLLESARAKLRTLELSSLLQRFSRVGDRFSRQSDALESDLHLLRDDAFRFMRRNADGLNTLHGSLTQMGDRVAQARLVPLSTLFDAFPRAVREIARNEKKEVYFKVENAEIGVDRALINDVRDALIHILRNAIDHGVELPETRRTLGKPASGTLSIRIRADGDMLHLEVEDDGKGMDARHLRESAIEKKIITRVQASALSERESIELIFRAGFSTREEVSDISGRGVGMDVVKRKIESLGGSVTIATRLGLGTTIHLRLPQSLSMMRVLLVRLGDDVYGVPAADVEAVTRVKPEDRIEVFGTLALRHRGKPVALVALGPMLGLNGGPRYDSPQAIIVVHGEDRAALVVDGFVDEREVAVKPCGGAFLKGAALLAGAAALEDGRIAVLLHVPDLMAEVRRLTRPVEQVTPVRRLRILLVDDSPIARATESALVRALGHTVEEAFNGEEGYAKAETGKYDLILTDVQMPRMDGFTLSRKLKSNPLLAQVPVIILSSLASPEDKRRGMDAGADAYLIKGELGVESLAQTFDRLT